MKRAFDIGVSFVALVATFPLMAAAALLIWLSDFANPIYVSRRARTPHSTFPMFKFRSMVPDGERHGGVSTAAGDHRVTPVGRVLRALKIDELPQLWNVLAGDMSIVGPRPQVLQGVERYTQEENALFSVRPGITDFASIVFADEGQILAEQPDPDVAYDKLIRPVKSRLGLFYAAKRTFVLDIALIGATVMAIVSRPLGLRAVQGLLRQCGADADLIEIAGRSSALRPSPPPGAQGQTPSMDCVQDRAGARW